MRVTRSGGRNTPGPDDRFTGTVRIDGVRDPDGPGSIGCGHVRFAPGARTAWHSHPRGRTLHVTDGIDRVARRGGPVEEIRPGDVVHVDPDEEHRHGASPDRFMAHIALQQADDDGQVVTWLEHVGDADHRAS